MFKRNFQINVLLFLASTLISLLFAEFLVRKFMPRYKVWDHRILRKEKGFRSLGIPNSHIQYESEKDNFKIEVN